MNRLSVAVTGLNAHAPGVAVIRAIRAACPSCEIVGFAYDSLDPGGYAQGIADHTYLLPYPSQGSDVFRARLLEINSRQPIDVLIPTLDTEIGATIKIQDQLHERGIRTFLPALTALARREKSRLHELTSCGLPVPKSFVITDATRISSLLEMLQLPVVVKGQFHEARIAYTEAGLHEHFRAISAQWGLPIIAQEYIDGCEFDVVGVGSDDADLVGAVAIRKMQLTDKGKAWGGVTIADPALDDLARTFVRELRWRGPFELELIRTEDERLFLIEANPRFPAWVYLCSGAERNLPWTTVQLALGKQVEKLPPALPGVMFLRETVDHVVPLSDYESLVTTGELHKKGVRT